jgi:acetyltransferase EpsM
MSLIIFGASGHGKVVIDAALECGRKVALVADDRPSRETLLGVRVVSSDAPEFRNLGAFSFIVSIGENQARARVYARLLALGGEPATLVHPRAMVSRHATLGGGTVVLAGAVVNAGTVIEENCILNTACSVDHDCVVGKHVHLCPGVRLAGGVLVAEGSMIGTGASVIPGQRVGEWSRVGAGAVVVRSLPARVVAFGVPARVSRSLPAAD